LVRFLTEAVLEAMVVCLMRIGEALPTKLLPKKLCRDDVRIVYKDGKLFEAAIRIYPLKQSVRARKAGQKVPIAIPANAGPYLMTAELLWLMVAPPTRLLVTARRFRCFAKHPNSQ
jgi:hypothetical protein